MDTPLPTTLQEQVDHYPHGWFVAIEENQVIAADKDFHELQKAVRAQGRDPRTTLVVEAGVRYPQHATIFL